MACTSSQPSSQLLADTLDTSKTSIQRQSPLFGQIPPEVRNLIFCYALTALTPPRPKVPKPINILYPTSSLQDEVVDAKNSAYPKNTKYTRPGHFARPRHTTSLLQVSKRVYMETAHLPASTKVPAFYNPIKSGPPGALEPEEYFRRMNARQLEWMREVEVFGGLAWIRGGDLESLCNLHAMRVVEVLRIGVRWCDWAGWKKGAPLALSMEDESDNENENEEEDEEMDDASSENEEDEVPQTPKAWSSAFNHLPNLKRVIFSLEAPVSKSKELEDIVKTISTWGVSTSSKSLELQKEMARSEWEGPVCAWSDFCPHCGSGGGTAEEERSCGERRRRRMRDLGPVLGGVEMVWC
jgi:hypothetical protein